MRTRIIDDIERDAGLEEWLRTKGVARYHAYHRAPKGHSTAKVFARLREHHAKRVKQTSLNKGA